LNCFATVRLYLEAITSTPLKETGMDFWNATSVEKAIGFLSTSELLRN
jgi:hypothetical protein